MRLAEWFLSLDGSFRTMREMQNSSMHAETSPQIVNWREMGEGGGDDKTRQLYTQRRLRAELNDNTTRIYFIIFSTFKQILFALVAIQNSIDRMKTINIRLPQTGSTKPTECFNRYSNKHHHRHHHHQQENNKKPTEKQEEKKLK